jgi:hypothetical protein
MSYRLLLTKFLSPQWRNRPLYFLIIMIFSGSEYKIYANAGKWLKDGLLASWSLSPPMLFPLDLESGTLMLRRTSPSFWRLMICR